MSDSAYCWFDWDDNTTTVNSINIIKEPRKPWRDYAIGESVLAKLPQFGLWRGVIVEISESKQDLIQKMNERQRLQIQLMQTDSVVSDTSDSEIDRTEEVTSGSKQSKSMKLKRDKSREADSEIDRTEEVTSGSKQSKNTKLKKDKSGEAEKKVKRKRELEEKEEEKKKKKQEEELKIEAKRRQVHEIIEERRKTASEDGYKTPDTGGLNTINTAGQQNSFYNQGEYQCTTTPTSVPNTGQQNSFYNQGEHQCTTTPTSVPNTGQQNSFYNQGEHQCTTTPTSVPNTGQQNSFYNQGEHQCTTTPTSVPNTGQQNSFYNQGEHQCTTTPTSVPNTGQQNSFYHQGQHQCTTTPTSVPNQFSFHQTQPDKYSGFSQYSFVNDLMSPGTQTPAGTYQQLFSYKELQDRNTFLEAEVQQLREENTALKEQLETMPSVASPALDLAVTPRKILFLKKLTSSLQESQGTEIPRMTRPKPDRLFRVRNAQQPSLPEDADEQPSTDSPAMNETGTMEQSSNGEEPLVENEHSSPWEESVTSSGVKKIRLVPNMEVYVTQSQLSQAMHIGASNPKRLLITLLDCLFSREKLAKSNAKGVRRAHNAKVKTSALPSAVLTAVKQFVLNKFKTEGGQPCLSDTDFNNTINNKCATARRALKM